MRLFPDARPGPRPGLAGSGDHRVAEAFGEVWVTNGALDSWRKLATLDDLRFDTGRPDAMGRIPSPSESAANAIDTRIDTTITPPCPRSSGSYATPKLP
ncbi:MAG: hypothetical protein KC656_07945 [Myxococcales bacterium]|nr:hypothetical protein [Myxococcales bacterium]